MGVNDPLFGLQRDSTAWHVVVVVVVVDVQTSNIKVFISMTQTSGPQFTDVLQMTLMKTINATLELIFRN